MQKIFLKLFLLLAFLTTSVFSINYTHSLESNYFHKQVAEKVYEKIENRYKNKTEIEKLIIYEVLSKKLDELILKVKDQDIKEVVKELKTYLTWESSIENPPIVGDPPQNPPIQNPPVVNNPPTQNPPKEKKKLCPHNGWYEPNFCLIKWKPIWKVKEYYVNSITWTKYSKIKKWLHSFKDADNYCKSLWKGWRLPRNRDFIILPILANTSPVDRLWPEEYTKFINSSIINIPPNLSDLTEKNDTPTSISPKNSVFIRVWTGRHYAYWLYSGPYIKPSLILYNHKVDKEIMWSVICLNNKVYFDNEKYAKVYYVPSTFDIGVYDSKFSSWLVKKSNQYWFKCSKEGEEKLFSYLERKNKCKKIFAECKNGLLDSGRLHSTTYMYWRLSSHIFEWWNCYLDN